MTKNKFKRIFQKEKPTEMDESANVYETIWRDFTEEEIIDVKFVKDFTMTSEERLISLSRSVDYLIQNDIGGDIVECGVWRGGSMMLVAKKLMRLKSYDRRLFLFDTFQGMTQPGKNDVSWSNMPAKIIYKEYSSDPNNEVWCFSELSEVKQNLNKTNYPKENLIFVPGKVEETLPNTEISNIALLRLDTDWYESTKHELECLFHKLTVGGILIIDDYGHWQGSKKAVDEFIKERKIKIFLNRIDYTGRIAVKLGEF